MYSPKRRLLTVQGPLQFIAGYVALSWQKEVEDRGIASEDHLLLYDFLTSKSTESDLARTVLELSRVSSWKKITFLTAVEMSSIMSTRYQKSIDRLTDLLQHSNFDEIYLARDCVGHGSALILNSYPNARRIAYGDSFGLFGMPETLRKSSWKSSLRTLNSQLRNSLRKVFRGGPAVLPFHVATLSIPIINSGASLNGISLQVPSKQHVLSCIDRICVAQKGLASYCASLVRPDAGGAMYLYLLSNFSAARFMRASEEVELYLEIIRNDTPRGSTIVLKPHPRSSYEVLVSVSNGLKNEYNVVVADNEEFSRFPVELWIQPIEVCTVVAVFSTSAIHMRYLYGKNVTLPLTDERINRYFSGDSREYVRQAHGVISQSLENVEYWDGASILWQKQA